jgi:hypothetical protein
MADDKNYTPPSDAKDLDSLWLDPGLGDGITNVSRHEVPIGKPRDFFRVHPDPSYRRRTEVYKHKPEGAIEEQHFIIAPSMRGRIEEARPATIVTCIYRDGSVRLWPISFPRDGERDNESWISARSAARAAIDKWVKVVWVRRAYLTREALPGYAPDPDLTKIPPFDDLVVLGYGQHGIIRDTDHPIYRELFGIKPDAGGDDGDDL